MSKLVGSPSPDEPGVQGTEGPDGWELWATRRLETIWLPAGGAIHNPSLWASRQCPGPSTPPPPPPVLPRTTDGLSEPADCTALEWYWRVDGTFLSRLLRTLADAESAGRDLDPGFRTSSYQIVAYFRGRFGEAEYRAVEARSRVGPRVELPPIPRVPPDYDDRPLLFVGLIPRPPPRGADSADVAPAPLPRASTAPRPGRRRRPGTATPGLFGD